MYKPYTKLLKITRQILIGGWLTFLIAVADSENGRHVTITATNPIWTTNMSATHGDTFIETTKYRSTFHRNATKLKILPNSSFTRLFPKTHHNKSRTTIIVTVIKMYSELGYALYKVIKWVKDVSVNNSSHQKTKLSQWSLNVDMYRNILYKNIITSKVISEAAVWAHIPGEPKKIPPPYNFCWYYSNAWEFLYEILHFIWSLNNRVKFHCCNINKSRRGGDFFLVHLVCSLSLFSSISLYWRWGFNKPSPSTSISGQNRCCC